MWTCVSARRAGGAIWAPTSLTPVITVRMGVGWVADCSTVLAEDVRLLRNIFLQRFNPTTASKNNQSWPISTLKTIALLIHCYFVQIQVLLQMYCKVLLERYCKHLCEGMCKQMLCKCYWQCYCKRYCEQYWQCIAGLLQRVLQAVLQASLQVLLAMYCRVIAKVATTAQLKVGIFHAAVSAEHWILATTYSLNPLKLSTV